MISIPKNRPERQVVPHAIEEARPERDSALVEFSADDAGNAEAVQLLYGDTILYTREYGWPVYNDRYWE